MGTDSQEKNHILKSSPRPWIALSILLLFLFLLTQAFEIDFSVKPKLSFLKKDKEQKSSAEVKIGTLDIKSLSNQVIPAEGVKLPIKWGDLGKRMVEAGVIDADKVRQLFGGNLTTQQEAMLTLTWDNKIVMTSENSRFFLDLLWAFGLGNKNPILEEGDMTKKEYGGAGNFASTGGWTLAKGDAMNHYSKHQFVTLTTRQQASVEEISKGIYRPCCGNSTYFPDCNHGMAMLGLLELMAAQEVSEDKMYKTALAVNSIWFPQTYIDIATYFTEQDKRWEDVDPKLVLGQEYSSGQGYQNTRAKIKSLPPVEKGGGGCGA